MMHFCTLFDSNYISKGIALYLSIERYSHEYTLYVMAMDRKCQKMLHDLGFERMVVDCIDDISDPALAQARTDRSRAEFCWTCGSYSTDYFLHQYNLPEITYLDSDLLFFSSPQVILDELQAKGASVGLSPHYTRSSLFGKYCVQYVYFKNDESGRTCLRWWRDECLKWCYSKLEGGKYGDQKYLDSFSGRFPNVCAIENRGAGIAYWNMERYRFNQGEVSFKGRRWPIVFFHYSGINVAVEEGALTFRHSMYLTTDIRKTFVEPYAEAMREAFSKYLDTPVREIRIVPLSRGKNVFKALMHYLSKVLPLDALVDAFMRIKYRERKSPYSERS